MKETVSFEQQFWHLNKEDALSSLSASLDGLTRENARKRLDIYGKNTLKDSTETLGLLLFLRQFKSPITLLLIAAAVLSAFLGDIPDTLIIFVIVLISSFLGYWQEKGAASAVKELLKIVQLRCTVLRDRQKQELPFEMVVPGDIVYVSAGDIIPGDALLLDSQELFVDEAAFTGETYPVEKKCGVLHENTPLSKRSNSLFMGAHIVSGKASILIMQTGAHTEFGKIYTQLQQSIPETDFERGIRHFGYLLMEITMVLVLLIFAANVFLHKPILDSLLFSLALAVGLTPQLLPAIVSVNLAKGAKDMAERKVIVKRLSSIENLGSMTVLCSDKTGTITEGKVNLKDTLGVDGLHSDKTLEYAWINASKQQGFRNPIDEAICLAYKGDDRFSLQTEVPYDFIRKRLTVEVKSEDLHIVISKGALNNILSICSQVELNDGKLDDLKKHADSIRVLYQQLSSSGFRTLGLAYKLWNDKASFTRTDEQGMVFMGFITLFDPPKVDIIATIKQLTDLGVGLKIITGDNELVATSLAISVGFQKPTILTGMMIQKMNNAALRHKAPYTDIFAEVEPNQKDRILSMLKKAGHVVGFMGDGVNDAPALHMADVGISVDTAVDVAKQAADIVLLDRNLNVVAEGILEGRKTFTNTMKYIFMATSANFGNMFSMAGASLFLPFLPLLPKQILLTNLLTDFPEMAIATDRVDQINLQKPQRWDFSFIKRFMIIFGLLSSVFDYLTFGVLILVLQSNEKQFQTGWFIESVLSATLIVLVVRTRLPFFKSIPSKYLFMTTMLILVFVLFIPITPMAEWFGFVKLPLIWYGWILIIVAMYVFSAEWMKSWFYKKVLKMK
jgi:Mg2+-importing ATPase